MENNNIKLPVIILEKNLIMLGQFVPDKLWPDSLSKHFLHLTFLWNSLIFKLNMTNRSKFIILGLTEGSTKEF